MPLDAAARPRTISLFSTTSLVIANMVGTGIFTSLGFQLVGLRSGFVILALWTLGGLCALCGALCYAELGTSLRRSGGEYNFLTRIYGRPVGFLAGWVSATTGFAAPVALAAMALGSYLHRIQPSLPAREAALVVILFLTSLHLLRPTIGTIFQNSFTILKVGLILTLIGLGFWHGSPEAVSFLPKIGDGALFTSPAFAISLVYVMYAYSGWNASTYMVSELEDPQRDIPRSLFIGTGLVMALYLGLNWVFLWSTPVASMAGQTEVGLIAANHMLGPRLGRLMGAAIALLLVSTISSMVRVGPRVVKTMGEDYPALRIFSATTRHGIPYLAVLFQSVISIVLVATGTFERVLVYAQLSLLLCTFLAALGVVILRIRKPRMPRPYRTWGYPVTPAIFLVVTFWMMAFVVKDRPLESLLGGLTLLAGLVVYHLPHLRRLLLPLPVPASPE